MKRIKSMVNKVYKKIPMALPALALLVGIFASQSACMSYYYQPETPSAMDKYR